MFSGIDLQIVWFILVAVLFAGYFLLEGFDFGVGMALPFAGRNEPRRAAMIRTIGPVWDGNEVWLITGGGALFAAFPEWYATMFSGFYLPLFLIILALIARNVALEWRGKVDTERWRRWCDAGIVVGSWVPPLVWGVAVANLLRGVPIDANRHIDSGLGVLLGLFNPYALLGGVALTALFLLHGVAFLRLKTRGEVREVMGSLSIPVGAVTAVAGAAFVLWTQLAHGKPWTWVLVALILLGVIGGIAALVLGRDGWSFIATSLAVLGVTALAFGSLFPDLMPTTLVDGVGLTIRNASSSAYTLNFMTWAAVLVTPLVLAYQAWTYWVFRKRIAAEPVSAAAGY